MVKNKLFLVILALMSYFQLSARGHGGGGHHAKHHAGGGHHAEGHHGGHSGHAHHGGHGEHHGGHHGGHYDGDFYKGYRGIGLAGGLGLGLGGLAWGAGLLGGVQYSYVLPEGYIEQYYGGNYPYWGYGLGYGEKLVVLAQEDKWEDIIQLLNTKKDELNAELQRLEQDPTANRQRSIEIKDQLAKIQLHLDGLLGARKY